MRPNNPKTSLPFYDIKVVSIISLVNDMLVSFDYPFKHGIENLRKLLLRYTQREQMAFTFTEKTRWSAGHAHALTPSPRPKQKQTSHKVLFIPICMPIYIWSPTPFKKEPKSSRKWVFCTIWLWTPFNRWHKCQAPSVFLTGTYYITQVGLEFFFSRWFLSVLLAVLELAL